MISKRYIVVLSFLLLLIVFFLWIKYKDSLWDILGYWYNSDLTCKTSGILIEWIYWVSWDQRFQDWARPSIDINWGKYYIDYASVISNPYGFRAIVEWKLMSKYTLQFSWVMETSYKYSDECKVNWGNCYSNDNKSCVWFVNLLEWEYQLLDR